MTLTRFFHYGVALLVCGACESKPDNAVNEIYISLLRTTIDTQCVCKTIACAQREAKDVVSILEDANAPNPATVAAAKSEADRGKACFTRLRRQIEAVDPKGIVYRLKPAGEPFANLVITSIAPAEIRAQADRAIVSAGALILLIVPEEPNLAEQKQNATELHEATEFIRDDKSVLLWKNKSDFYSFVAKIDVDGKAFTCRSDALLDFTKAQARVLLRMCQSVAPAL